jgi:hypothetical protein
MIIEILIIVAAYGFYAYGKARTDTRQFRDEKKWHIWNTLSYWNFAAATGIIFRVVDPGFRAALIALVGWWLSQRAFEGFYSVLKTGRWYGEQTRTIPVEWLNGTIRDGISSLTGIQCKWDQFRLEGNVAKIADAVRVGVGGIALYLLLM